jgi:DNA uptake protein ComE-like DNA-binding protein
MRRSKQFGGVFVVSLAVLTGLVSILALAAASQRAANQTQIRRMESRRARILAEAGIQRALASLQNQPVTPTTLNDDWAILGQAGSEAFELGRGTFRIQIVDAAAKINVNTADQAQLELLPLDIEQIDSILDWREESRQPRSGGAKDEYYNQLAQPYNAKLGAFGSVDELLNVKGITALDLFTVRDDVVSTNRPTRSTTGEQVQLPLDELVTVDSVSRGVDSTEQAKLNVNQATAPQLVQRAQVSLQVATQIVQQRPGGGYANIGQILSVPGVNIQSARTILSNCQVGGPNLAGKINLNTVSEETLLTVPNLPPDVASAIVTRQSSGFADLGDLVDVPGMNNLALLQQTAGYFEVNSQAFLVRVLGVSGATRVALQATVSLADGAPKVIRVEQPPYADVLTVWGWEDAPVATTTIKGAQ